MQSTIMRNARMDEAQVGIRIAGRNINNLRYADDTTLTAESKEEQNVIVQLSQPYKMIQYKMIQYPYKAIHMFQSHLSNYSGRRAESGKSRGLTLVPFS